MRLPTVNSPQRQFLAWLASVIILGSAGFLAIGATYQEFMDCSNPELHESANTSLGWTVAVLASAAPVFIATWLARGLWHRLPVLAFAVAMFSLPIWWWILDADCEWYALALV